MMKIVTSAFADAPDERERVLDLDRVEPRQDLVQKQEPWPRGEGAGYLQALPAGQGHALRVGVGLFGEPEPLQHPEGFRPRQPGVTLPGQDRGHHVLQDRHALEGPDDLEGPADPQAAPAECRELRDVGPPEDDRSARGRQQTRDEIEHGGLPRPVGADQPEDLALPDLEADPGDGRQATEVLAEVADTEQRHHASSLAGTGEAAARTRRRMACRAEMIPPGSTITTTISVTP